MLYYESDYSAEGLVEKVNSHEGKITIHTIQVMTVINEDGSPAVAFVAFFSIEPHVTTETTKSSAMKRFIGQQKPPA